MKICSKYEKCLQEKGLPLKCLLLLDIAPAHPPGLEEDLAKEFDFIQVKCLPPNSTQISQPIYKQVISNLNNCTLMACFGSVFEIINDTEITLI